MTQNELNKFKAQLINTQPTVKLFAIGDNQFSKKFSINKFPYVIFYRNGRFIQYKGKSEAKFLVKRESRI